MKQVHKSERGQVLVIVVFGLVALIGMAALAVDGGNAYSDRRHAQNAADTAALAAGLTWVRNPTDWSAAADAGLARADENGYDDNGASNVVDVHRCDEPGANCNLPSPLETLPGGSQDLPEYYIQATITSHVPTYLARVLGIAQMTNKVQAIAHAVPSFRQDWYKGAALVSLMPRCKPPDGSWPYDPFTLTGTTKSIISGSGVFVNSDCGNAFTGQNNTTLLTPDGKTCVVGGVISNGVVVPPADDYCSSGIDMQTFQMPAVSSDSCLDAGQIDDLGGGIYLAHPGYYNDSFPNVSPAGTLKLMKGIYCLNNGMNFSAQWSVTTDLDGVGQFDGSDCQPEGVLFYVPHGEVTFNGGTAVKIAAMNPRPACPDPGDAGINGYLIYLPETNDSPVKIAGNNGSQFVGTILAPRSLVTLEGGSATDSLRLECQIMGYSLRVTGNGTLDITYNNEKIGQGWTSPILEPYR